MIKAGSPSGPGRTAALGAALIGVLGASFASAPVAASPPEVQSTSVAVGVALGQRFMSLTPPGLDHRVSAWPGATLDLRQVLWRPASLNAALELRLQGTYFRGTSQGRSFDAPDGLSSQRFSTQATLGLTRPLGPFQVTLGTGFSLDGTTVTANTEYTGQQYLAVPVDLVLRVPFGTDFYGGVHLTALPVVAYNQSATTPDHNSFGGRAALSAGWRATDAGITVELALTHQRMVTYLPLNTGERGLSLDVNQQMAVMVGWSR
ncbi:hypothetical protein DL240_11470 [Lujinxingia litoralis]|uniref:Outer membrane protein beta-barrel domain-containing protein n=1 Tax=Lujinxingia litoralis TaxID=2211119 RepID=A0A328CB67_9DELT|nr:hypothetical protein [Lujinxingia litoralis]RAL22457.1 hypothetical protein DL240_11470 [Lujinxingia litoralis]